MLLINYTSLKKSILLFVLFLSFGGFSAAQDRDYYVANLKNGTTYFVLPELQSPSAKKYIEIAQNTWKASKVNFITPGDVKNNLSKDNYFITVEFDVEENYAQTFQSSGAKVRLIYTSLKLWTPSKKFLELAAKKDTFFNEDDKEILDYHFISGDNEFLALLDNPGLKLFGDKREEKGKYWQKLHKSAYSDAM